MSAREADFGLEISKGVLAKFVMAAVGFVGSVVFARELGPSGYGAFYLIHTLVSVLDNPITGWGEACKKRISENDFSPPEALGSALLGAAILPVIILPLVFIGNRFTGTFDLTGLYLPFTGLFISMGFFGVTNRILSARSNFSAADWADTLRSLFTTPLQLLLVLLGFQVTGMIYGLTIATLFSVPYVLYKTGVRPRVPSKDTIGSIGSFAKYSIPNGFIGTAQSRIDILLLGAIVSAGAVGEYQVSMQLTMAGTFIGGVASMGLMARVSDHWSRGDPPSAVNDVTNALGFASILAIPIFFGAAAMPEDLVVTVFGPQYAGSGTVLVGLALFQVLSMQSMQLEATISGLNRPDVNTRIGVVVLVLNVALGYALLIRHGVFGVVVATIISEGVKYLSLSYTVKKHLPQVPLLNRTLRAELLSGVAMFAIVELVHSTYGVSWWGDLTVLISLGSIAYFVALVVLSESFRVTVKGILDDALSG